MRRSVVIMFQRMLQFDLDDDVPRDTWSKWGVGIAVPSMIAIYGITLIVLRQAVLYGKRGHLMNLTGWDAVVFGITIVAVALFLHARYFWSNSESLCEFAELVQVSAMLTGVVGFGFVIVRNFTLI